MTHADGYKPIIIYIGGYGRSGSSILEAALHTIIKQSSSLGEVAVILDSMQDTRLGCSCGDSHYLCTPWSQVQSFLHDKEAANKFQYYSKKENIGFKFSGSFAEDYGKFWMKIFRMRTKKDVIIDSSKTSYRYCNRAKILAESGAFDVFFIHISRDILGILRSRAKGTNKELFGIQDKSLFIVGFLKKLMWPIITLVSQIAANY